MASVNDVEVFLTDFKAKMCLFPEEIAIINSRPENAQTLAILEITVAQQLHIIRNLQGKDYSSGPLDDDNKHRDLIWWVFGVKIKNKEVYIKLSLNKLNMIPICISFHISTKKLQYPFINQ